MGRDRSWGVRITTAECAVELRCSAGGFCSVVLQCGFAVGCEDSEDTGFCPLRIMWCAPEHSIFSICRFWEKRQLPANPVKIKGYSDFMIFPQNKKFPINLVFGNIFGKSAGAVSPFPSGEEWRK